MREKLESIRDGLKNNAFYFIKWCIIAYIAGGLGGIVGGIFGRLIGIAAAFRTSHDEILLAMPVVGLLIVWLYQVTGEGKNRGTNMVLEAISSDKTVTPATGPLIFISTVLTHLVGGSAGREGAALQIGGSIGTYVGKFFRLDEKEEKIAVMCGMAAVFAALFGTPVGAAVFCMEVISVGIMYYAALLPCLMAASVGKDVAMLFGMKPEIFHIEGPIPALTYATVNPVVVLGLLLAVLSIVFVVLLHETDHLFKRLFASPYLRVVAVSILFLAMTALSGTRLYNGSSIEIIERSLEGDADWRMFLFKMIFTAVALGGGFKGGEIIPTLCVGAAFGALIGNLLGFEPSLMAACGMIGLFAAVTNCPISSILLGLEMFEGHGLAFFAVVVSISFTLSGYYSLYGSQKFTYAKLRNEYLNRQSDQH